MPKLTVKDLLDLKGIRKIAFVQVAREEEALAAAAAGMDMIGTGFRAETRHFPELVPDVHFQFGLAWPGASMPVPRRRCANRCKRWRLVPSLFIVR